MTRDSAINVPGRVRSVHAWRKRSENPRDSLVASLWRIVTSSLVRTTAANQRDFGTVSGLTTAGTQTAESAHVAHEISFARCMPLSVRTCVQLAKACRRSGARATCGLKYRRRRGEGQRVCTRGGQKSRQCNREGRQQNRPKDRRLTRKRAAVLALQHPKGALRRAINSS